MNSLVETLKVDENGDMNNKDNNSNYTIYFLHAERWTKSLMSSMCSV